MFVRSFTENRGIQLLNNLIQFQNLSLEKLHFVRRNEFVTFQEKILSLSERIEKITDHRSKFIFNGRTFNREIFNWSSRLFQRLVQMKEKCLRLNEELFGH